MYKNQEEEVYKTTTIRIKKEYYNILKEKAIKDYRSTNYIINKILIDYLNKKELNIDFDIDLD